MNKEKEVKNTSRRGFIRTAAVAGCDQARPARTDGPRSIGDGSLHMTMRFCSATSSVTNACPFTELALF